MNNVRCAFSDTLGGLVEVPGCFTDVPGINVRALLKGGLGVISNLELQVFGHKPGNP